MKVAPINKKVAPKKLQQKIKTLQKCCKQKMTIINSAIYAFVERCTSNYRQ